MPRDILGRSTFELAVFLARWLPIRLVDKLLVILAWLVLGDIEKFGIERPTMGPMELKNRKGKTPVLDTGALEKIRSGKIKVVPARIKRFEPSNRVEFVNGDRLKFDSVVLATGYRSNVPSWLQVGSRLCLHFLKVQTFLLVSPIGSYQSGRISTIQLPRRDGLSRSLLDT